MFGGFATALLAGAAAVTAASADTGPSHGPSHSVRIDHPRGGVDADYRSQVAISHTQIGAVTPGGVPSTLRCAWQADLTVERDARHAGGATMARTMVRDGALSGSRPGWCTGVKAAIARDVADRGATLRDHLVAIAEADRAVLTAEIDRLHDTARRG